MDMLTSYGHIIKLKKNHRFFMILDLAGHVPLIVLTYKFSQCDTAP